MPVMSDTANQAITGVILTGGRATRMGGQDKGLLPLAGQPLIAYAVRALRPQVGALLINANRNIDAYGGFGCTVAPDRAGHFLGPLAGMLTALEHATTPYVVSVPCDSPLLPQDYTERMYTALLQHRAELSVASDGERLQPVFALLSTALAASLNAYLDNGERKIDRWFARHSMVAVDFSDTPAMFRNINTPEELRVLDSELQG